MTKQYIIDATAETWSPYTGTFIVTTVPTTHDLCGGVSFQPQYNSMDLDGSEPIIYNTDDNEFTVESNDGTLIATTNFYQLVATLADYPISTYPTAVWSVTRQG